MATQPMGMEKTRPGSSSGSQGGEGRGAGSAHPRGAEFSFRSFQLSARNKNSKARTGRPTDHKHKQQLVASKGNPRKEFPGQV